MSSPSNLPSQETPPSPNGQWIKWFENLDIDEVPIVGGKNASLGELYSSLQPLGINVPNGFAITADAYRYFLKNAGLDQHIPELLGSLDTSDLDNLRQHGSQIRRAILSANMPNDLEAAIVKAYAELSTQETGTVDVAVRSSATAEDRPDASFAGQQETYLNVRGSYGLLDACKRCFASLYTDRAISYRSDQGYNDLDIALSIGVQTMVRSDLSASGVMFSIDTETGFRDVVLINAAYGLGENIVQGAVNPDEYCVFKPTLEDDKRPILKKTVGTKELRMIYDTSEGRGIKNVKVPESERATYALPDEDILTLAKWATMIESHYSKRRNESTPMDIEWAKDGRTGELFIVQARPETVQSRKNVHTFDQFSLKEKGKVLVEGRSVGDKIVAGTVRRIENVHQADEFQAGEILVADNTDPDWEPIMKIAGGIVTDRGGRTCHAAIVSRELGVPAIVGCNDATQKLKTGSLVTVSCAEGETGFIYEGKLQFERTTQDIQGMARPRTSIMMNVANPEKALALSFIPNDGVGLARMEFIINNYIKIHPLALVHFSKLNPTPDAAEIRRITAQYTNKTDYFVDQLAQGISMIAAAFYPKDVILRLSDFKSNEYANLLGGEQFEPQEENPMIGFRGASRYYDPRYQEGFALECEAIRRVRESMGLCNLKVMVPFCRTVQEGLNVLQEMKKNGLQQGKNGLEVYVMCEVPSNVILAKEFAEIFDGFSIGSNDLTQLTLGVDRDSEIIAHIFDERNQAVKRSIRQVITTAKAAGCKIGICGQAPSDYPDFAQFLVEAGIDSISLIPDTVIETTLAILEQEKTLSQEEL